MNNKALLEALGESFTRAMLEDFQKHGKECLERLAKEDPEAFARLAVEIMGEETEIRLI